MNTPPTQVPLTYSEAVEPRFAIVSVTDADGAPADGRGRRAARRRTPTRSSCRCKHLRRGLVPRLLARDLGRRPSGARRVHVRGRAEPGPGAAVRDPVDLRDRGDAAAASPRAGSRSCRVMAAIGLFVLRIVDRAAARAARAGHAAARGRRSRSSSPPRSRSSRSRSTSLLATAKFALRSCLDVGALVPLMRVSAFGRGYLDLELLLALFVLAARVALWVDRPEREHALGRRAARAQRRAARRGARCCSSRASPATRRRRRRARWRSRSTGRTSSAGSVWLGGLIGLLVLWREPACRRGASPGSSSACRASRTSRSSRCSCCRRPAIGASVLHLPTLAVALADVVRQGDPRQDRRCSASRCSLAAVNLLRTTPAAAGVRASGRSSGRRGDAAAPARRRRGRCSSPAPSSPPRC